MDPQTNNNTDVTGSDFIPHTPVPIPPPTSSTSSLMPLVIALVLDLVGFGSCFLAFEYEFLLIIPTLCYLAAAVFSIQSIVRARSIRNPLGRLAVIVIALIVGGWGAFWGIYGIDLILSGDSMY